MTIVRKDKVSGKDNKEHDKKRVPSAGKRGRKPAIVGKDGKTIPNASIRVPEYIADTISALSEKENVTKLEASVLLWEQKIESHAELESLQQVKAELEQKVTELTENNKALNVLVKKINKDRKQEQVQFLAATEAVVKKAGGFQCIDEMKGSMADKLSTANKKNQRLNNKLRTLTDQNAGLHAEIAELEKKLDVVSKLKEELKDL